MSRIAKFALWGAVGFCIGGAINGSLLTAFSGVSVWIGIAYPVLTAEIGDYFFIVYRYLNYFTVYGYGSPFNWTVSVSNGQGDLRI